MRKAKIMLMTIIILAFVGGALAFKVKTVSQPFICTTTLLVGENLCSFATHGSITNLLVGGDMVVYYTTDVVPDMFDQSRADAFCATHECPFESFIHFDD